MQNLNKDHLGSTILHAISVGKDIYSRQQHNITLTDFAGISKDSEGKLKLHCKINNDLVGTKCPNFYHHSDPKNKKKKHAIII